MPSINPGHCIIAAKGLVHGKSRLAAYLDAQARQALNRRNIERTVEAAIACFGPAQCVVVSPCPLTCAWVCRMGVRPLHQALNDGLNAGVELGRDYWRRQQARTLTVLPVDLPHISPAVLTALLSVHEQPGQAVIVPDTLAEGTNLLSFPADAALKFCFGADSFRAHLKQLHRGLLGVHMAQPSVLQLDIDTIEQLRAVEPAPLRERRFSPLAA